MRTLNTCYINSYVYTQVYINHFVLEILQNQKILEKIRFSIFPLPKNVNDFINIPHYTISKGSHNV